MCSWMSVILCFTFFNLLVLFQCAPELPAGDSYGIVATEWAIRDTLNNLFSTLKLKVIQRKLKLKQYSKIHNFFVSITLRDQDNLKKIAKLTEVDNIDNGTQLFITQLNEVLGEDNKSDETTNSVYVQILIEEFIDRLDYLKERNELQNNTKFDLNKAILRYFNNHENEFGNTTYFKEEHITGNDSDNNVLDSIESWQLSGRRIFSGKKSNIQRFPFMASVQFFKKFQCGGSIIKSDLVITSASCLQFFYPVYSNIFVCYMNIRFMIVFVVRAWNNRFFRDNPLFLSVQVGSSSYERGGENIPILEVHFHPSFNPKNLKHNLALMRLTRKLKFVKKSNSKIKKINFDRNPWPLPPNAGSIVIVGWGAKTFGTNMVNLWKNKLSFATLDFYPLAECQEIYTKEFVTERNFCAGFFSKGGGACNHDAGGPGILSGILTGVISFGAPVCGTRDAPTVFTKLGYYTDWIEEIMEQPILTGNHLTTPREVTFPTFPKPTFEKTTPFKVTPIVFEDPLKDNRFESLRTNDKEHEFGDFLKTMFKKKKQIAQHQKQEDKEEKETDSLLEESAQNVKEKDELEIEQLLRQKPETETEKERKPQSQSIENSADEIGTVRPSTIFDIDSAIVTSMQNDYNARASSTPSFNKHNDRNETANSSQEKDFDEAVENLLDNLNIDYILESKTSPPKDQHQMRAKDQLFKHTELNKFNSDTTTYAKNFKGLSPRSVAKNEEDQSDAINRNENENKIGDSGKDASDSGKDASDSGKDASDSGKDASDSGKDASDEEDSFSEKNNEQDVNDDKTAEITDRSQNADSVEDYRNDKNKPSEEVVPTVNTDDEKKDYETDDESKTNEGSEGFGIATEVLEQEHSSNSSERLLEMMEYEDLYKLLMSDT